METNYKGKTKRTNLPTNTKVSYSHHTCIMFKHADIGVGTSQYEARTDMTHVAFGNMSCHE